VCTEGKLFHTATLFLCVLYYIHSLLYTIKIATTVHSLSCTWIRFWECVSNHFRPRNAVNSPLTLFFFANVFYEMQVQHSVLGNVYMKDLIPCLRAFRAIDLNRDWEFAIWHARIWYFKWPIKRPGWWWWCQSGCFHVLSSKTVDRVYSDVAWVVLTVVPVSEERLHFCTRLCCP